MPTQEALTDAARRQCGERSHTDNPCPGRLSEFCKTRLYAVRRSCKSGPPWRRRHRMGYPSKPQVVEGCFDDIDAMAASPLAWNQEYQQLGRGRFHGHLDPASPGSVAIGPRGVVARRAAARHRTRGHLGVWPAARRRRLAARAPKAGAAWRAHRGDIARRCRLRRDRTNRPDGRRAADAADRSLGAGTAWDRQVQRRASVSALAGACLRDDAGAPVRCPICCRHSRRNRTIV